ncbi:MAG: glycosyltransferase family 4 protein, partial [Anaerolineae bacterium]
GMRIAQIAPLYEAVPPRLYGGTERVISYLTEELVRRGHEVTLFASGDSVTESQLVAVSPEALRLSKTLVDPFPYHTLQLGLVFDRSDEFDVIHSHVDYYAFPYTRLVETPVVTTLHGRLDLPELQAIYEEYPELNLVSISDDQRRPLAHLELNWLATVYHGLPPDQLGPFHAESGKYLAFLGRISPEKRPEIAILIAKETGIPLKIAAKVDPVDETFFEHAVKPLIDPGIIEFVGEITEKERKGFLGQAYATLFPIEWPEPFGLIMIESLSCGTPVIARRFGSVPEVMTDGVTGFVCSSVREMIDAVGRIPEIDRKACRSHVQERFTDSVMAENYESVYARLRG